jgi:hypothetical protein
LACSPNGYSFPLCGCALGNFRHEVSVDQNYPTIRGFSAAE